MDYDLRKYVKIYDDVFTPEFCASTVSQLEEVEWKKHSYYVSKDNKNISFDNELSVTSHQVPNKEKIDMDIWKVLHQYVNLDMAFPWMDGWNGYSWVRFNRYSIGELMRTHCDHIHSLFEGQRKGVPMLSILGALNEDYKGGEFIMWEQEEIKLKTGSVMVFPSNFLYPHRVDPVKSGTRYSYVSWAW